MNSSDGVVKAAGEPTRGDEYEVQVPCDGVVLEGTLGMSAVVRGVVLFAHGSGSSRFSPRNRFVAARLREASFATLLLDLLTPDEEREDERTRQHRFDIELLAGRLAGAADWLETTVGLPAASLGCFGASTGAAAALMAAAARPTLVGAVVSRGGRPDLAGPTLSSVRAPTLLIVGADDLPVIELNQEALENLTCTKALDIVPGATHLFSEPGALEAVADLATRWFDRQMPGEILPARQPPTNGRLVRAEQRRRPAPGW
jgi:putative phosphoribosyl transferase